MYALYRLVPMSADSIDLLPTSLRDLRHAWEELGRNVAALPDAGRLAALFAGLQAAASREGRSLLQLSALIALGAARAGIELGHTHSFTQRSTAALRLTNGGI